VSAYDERPESTRSRHPNSYRHAERTSAFEWRRGGLERPKWAQSGRRPAALNVRS
jgi:hypothetical protein